MKTLAPFLFLAGCWLGVICGFRINVRVFQAVESWRPTRRPKWDPTHIILGIRLRNTLVLEIVGLTVALAAIAIAIPILKSA
jgi:hypothetical protein